MSIKGGLGTLKRWGLDPSFLDVRMELKGKNVKAPMNVKTSNHYSMRCNERWILDEGVGVGVGRRVRYF